MHAKTVFCPPIRFCNKEIIEYVHENSLISDRLKELCDKAWKLLFKQNYNFITSLDIVLDGETAQMTPLVTNNGVAIRLDLGSISPIYALAHPDLNEQVLTKCYSIIVHELFHLRDRLDPAFKVDFHEDSVLTTDSLRKYINIAWDVYIERRKLLNFGIKPISMISSEMEGKEKEVVLHSLGEIDTTMKKFLENVWESGSEYTWEDFYHFALEMEKLRAKK